MRSYDAGGALLSEEDLEVPGVQDLVETANELIGDSDFPVGEVVRGLLVGRGLGDEAEWNKYIDDPGAKVVARSGGFVTATVSNITDIAPGTVEAVILYRDLDGDRTVHGVRLYWQGSSTPFSEVLFAYGNGTDDYQTLDMVQTTIEVDLPGSGYVGATPTSGPSTPGPTAPAPGPSLPDDRPIMLTTVSAISDYEAQLF